MKGNPASAGSLRGLKIAGVLLVGLLAGVLLLVGMLAGERSADAQQQFPEGEAQNPTDLDDGRCTRHLVTTTIPDPEDLVEGEGDATADIYGELCLPRRGTPKTVQLLMHGITYGTYYWDFPGQGEKYSWVDYMTNNGYATFNIDRLGIGRSDHPPSALVTLDSNAMVASQIVDKLKRGDIGRKAFEHVIYIGHSYGTATSWLAQSEAEQGTEGYPGEADVIIGTGWSHRLQQEPAGRFFQEEEDTDTDEKFNQEAYPGNYFTPIQPPPPSPEEGADNEREKDYLYYLFNADPEILELDSQYRQTVTQEELATFQNRDFDMTTENITIPVFHINGIADIFFCGGNNPDTDPAFYCGDANGLSIYEGQYFQDAACFTADVVPAAGHDLNLQRNHRTTFEIAKKFANTALGPNGKNARRYANNCEPPPDPPDFALEEAEDPQPPFNDPPFVLGQPLSPITLP